MKFWPVVLAALLRNRTRTVFTLLAVMSAFVLLGLLDSVRSAFLHAGEGMPGVSEAKA